MTLPWFDDDPIGCSRLLSSHRWQLELLNLWHSVAFDPRVWHLKSNARLKGFYYLWLTLLWGKIQQELTFEITQEDYTDAVAIIFWSMWSLQAPSSSFVNIAITAYDEIVTDITEIPAAFMIGLYILYKSLTGALGITSIRIIRMVYDHIIYGSIDARRRSSGCCSPATTWLDGYRHTAR